MSVSVQPEPDVAPTRELADVRLQNVTKAFGDVVAVDDLTLTIRHGEFFSLLGPSGCGKTTTLGMIGGFEPPTSGQIFLGDQNVSKVPAYKRDVNTVFQSYALFPHLDVFENIAFGLKRRRLQKRDIADRVSEALRIPTVGIGAGPHCDAQIMVWQDMAGLTTGRLPRFVKRYADVRGTLLDAAHRYVTEVASQHYPDPAHSYT